MNCVECDTPFDVAVIVSVDVPAGVPVVPVRTWSALPNGKLGMCHDCLSM